MVTIVNKTPDPSVVKRVICKNCGVALEYVPMEVTEKVVRDYSGDSDTWRYINCPNCKDKVTVR